MKKQTLLLFMTLLGQFLYAQEGEIIYTDFEPDLQRDFPVGLNPPYMYLPLDLNQDGVNDWMFYRWGREVIAMEFRPMANDWSPFRATTQLNFGDTIANQEWYSYSYLPPEIKTTCDFYVSFRSQTDDGFCYGWVEGSADCGHISGSGYPDENITLFVKRMAYCTIPNYPLRVGQEDFTWDIEENETSAFATIHPNPTTGIVRIIGKNLKAAEVVNTLGQRVATTQGQGETLQIDIANLPEGIYFVRVTDEQGRKCVRKVVKE